MGIALVYAATKTDRYFWLGVGSALLFVISLAISVMAFAHLFPR